MELVGDRRVNEVAWTMREMADEKWRPVVSEFGLADACAVRLGKDHRSTVLTDDKLLIEGCRAQVVAVTDVRGLLR